MSEKLTKKLLESKKHKKLSDIKSDLVGVKTQLGAIKTDIIATFEMHSTQHKEMEKVIDALDELWKSLISKK
jgi:hypothetical protein